jgi:hypothetical protein
MRLEADPDRFNLKNREAKRMQQVEFVLLPQRHDVENANAQGPDVLTLGLLGFNPRDPIPFNSGDLVIIPRKYQCHQFRSPPLTDFDSSCVQ